MPVSKFDRFLPITGVIAGLLALASFISTGPDSPDDPKVVTYLNSHQGELTALSLLTGLWCVAMLFFATAIRQALRSGEPGEGSYSSVAYAGAVLVGLSGALNAVTQMAMLDAAHHHHDDAVRTIGYLSEFGWLPWVTASAAMLLGCGIGGLRTSVLPKWLSIVSIVLGVMCLLGPTGAVVFFVQPLWFVAIGVVLYQRLHRSPAPLVSSASVSVGV
jgi:hypothetical protein